MDHSIQQGRSLKKLGFILYVAGSLLCMVIWASMTWGDFEASLFGQYLPVEETLRTLKCPVLISKSETAIIRAKFNNNSDRVLNTNVRAFLSVGSISYADQIDTRISLRPGEAQTLEWPVTADQAVWKRLIMARVYSFRAYPVPAYGASCGILVVDILNIPGRYLLVIALGLGIGLLAVGIYLWLKESELQEGKASLASAVKSNLVLIIAGLVVGYTGNWIFSLLLLLANLLLIMVIWAAFVHRN